MRAISLWLVALAAAMLAAAITVNALPSDISMLDISASMPVDLSESPDGMTAAAVARLHEAAGSQADEAIREAEHEAMLMETDSILAAGSASASKKWDDSVPEVHLKSTQPEEFLSTELETVDHLEHARASLTREDLASPQDLMAAFPNHSPAILGEADHAFIQHASHQQAMQQQHAQAQQQVVVATEADADTDADASILTEAEQKAGVMTLGELKQMMELEGMSQQEIDQYMEHLGETVVDTASEATQETETETETEGETESENESESETESESEGESDSETEAETETESDSETEVDADIEAVLDAVIQSAAGAATETEGEAEAESESESEPTEAQLLEIQNKAEAEATAAMTQEELDQIQLEADASMAKEMIAKGETPPPVLLEAKAKFEAQANGETEHAAASDMDAAAEQEAEHDVAAEQLSAPQSQQQDEVVHLAEHDAPAQLQEAVQSKVTPMHSNKFLRRHPSLAKLAQAAANKGPSGYSLPQPMPQQQQRQQAPMQQQQVRMQRIPQPVMMETRAVSYQRARSDDLDTSKFNPSAIQLGPSKDVYGYAPMTGAEFLHAPQQAASLAQVSMQMQHQQGSWLPPPIEAQATPNYVVGMGGLMPNRNAGPYQGQYGLAAGGQPIPEEPAFIQY